VRRTKGASTARIEVRLTGSEEASVVRCFRVYYGREGGEGLTRILAFDISASPGVAVIEIKKNKPRLLYVDSVKTDTKFNDAQRYNYIEAFAVKAIHEYGPFDTVCREKYTGSSRSKRAKQLVYG